MDVPLAHLDRPFDYLVPAEMDEAATAGVRVRVRFAGQLVGGFVLARAEESAHDGRLAFLERVVSPEPVLTSEVAALARAVADRYAGTLPDVLRLAVPPRHARAEQDRPRPPAATGGPARGGEPVGAGEPARAGGPAGTGEQAGSWSRYRAGAALLRALSGGRAPRAVWTALPGEDWPARLAEAIEAMLDQGRGALAVVPDARDLERLDAALTGVLGTPDRHVALSAALGPAERYRRFLAAARGAARAVVGTRAAMFAPVADLGLVVLWDDGDDLHAEPRAPYPHAREVLLTRAQLTGAAALVGGFARTAEAQLLLETGWAVEIAGAREAVRAAAPRVIPVGDDAQLARDPAAAAARLPTAAWQAARDALRAGSPVLVQVPRRGYLPAVSCVDCRAPARCRHCHGPLELRSSHAVAACRWCGRPAAAYACPHCGGERLRAAVVGARRTAEELGRAFPGAAVRTSGRDGVLGSVPDEPALVVATPGAEPVARGPGYGAVLLLDTWALLTRTDLRAGEEALRRWLHAAALARPAGAGGRVVVAADGGLPTVQALLRFDPGWYAGRELAERRELGFPPATRMASLTGPRDAVADLLAVARLPDGAQLLGPIPVPLRGGGRGDGGGTAPDPEPAGPVERVLVRVNRSAAPALAAALHAAVAVRSARKAPDPVRVQLDPLDLL
ncbi:MAG TPA: primosomal protein N' [Micromonosporaceae bacterium]|nr:primosomal protein N' [Micromonosporaceae bacterium]